MQKSVAGLIFLIALAIPAWAGAEAADWYAALGAGWNFAEDLELPESGRIVFDYGAPALTLTLGYRLNPAWRFELDLSHRQTDLEVVFLPETGEEIMPGASDRARAESAQLSVLRDFRAGSALRPYLGLGLGPARVEAEISRRNSYPRDVLLDDTEWVLAWQLIAGFSMPMGERWDLAVDYRFWQAPEVKLTDKAGGELDLEHSVHSGMLHVRYLFGERIGPANASVARNDKAMYVSANLGLGLPMDAEISDSLENFDAFRVGPSASVAVGRGFGDRWRFEAELAGRRNDVEVIDFNPGIGQFAADGRAKVTSVMANGLYQLRPGRVVRPVVGAGLGIAFADYKVAIQDEPYVEDKATGVAAQVILGLDVAVTERLVFTADYRSWYATGLKMDRPNGDPLETSQLIHTTSIGFRYSMR